MKINFIAVILILVSLGCNNNSKNKGITTDLIKNPVTASGETNNSSMPEIKFKKDTHDFGLLLQGEKVSYTFKFKNIGKGDLIIKDATATCGCTVPKFSRAPIPSGGEGEIEVIFDSNNRTGRQVKTITVWTNSQPNQAKLQIISEIVVPK
jgi:hypothetical protein